MEKEKILTKEEKLAQKNQRILKNELVTVLETQEDFNKIIDVAHKKMAKSIAVMEEEMLQEIPNELKFSAASKMNAAIKNLTSSVLSQKQATVEEHLNLHSPKMQMVFAFFMNEVYDSFKMCGFDKESQDLFFRTLSGKLVGWVETMQKKLKSSSTTTDSLSIENQG